MLFECLAYRLQAPYKDTRVPQIIATLQVLLRRLQIRLLLKLLDGINTFFERSGLLSFDLRLICELNVPIPSFRPCRLHAQRTYRFVLPYEIKSPLYRLSELLLLQYQVITRRHDDADVFCLLSFDFRLNLRRRISDTRRRIPSCGLAEYLFGLHVGDLFQDDISVGYVRDDQYVLDRHHRTKTVDGHLQQAAAGAEEVQKLFRLLLTAVRPESATDTARHNHAIVVLFHIHNLLPACAPVRTGVYAFWAQR